MVLIDLIHIIILQIIEDGGTGKMLDMQTLFPF